jgi:parallel beta-helix repeat protein
MKSKITAVMIIAFVLLSSSTVLPVSSEDIIETLSGNTLYVGGTGDGNYTRIQDAIDNATSGDTVFVYNGTYYEHVGINTPLTLVGENKNTTIIDGGGSGRVIYASANNVEINNFTIQNGKDGISIQKSSNIKILGNIIRNNEHDGIISLEGGYFTITGNIISTNKAYGIAINQADGNNIISGNTIKHHGKHALLIWYSSIEITNNNFIDNSWLEAQFFGSKNHPHHWNSNYWGRPRFFWRPIIGTKTGHEWYLANLMLEWDKNPAQEPYNIGGAE